MYRILTKQLPKRPILSHTQGTWRPPPHHLRPILLFDIEENLHNKHLGKLSMIITEELGDLSPEQYVSRKWKAADTHPPNTRLFYNILRLKRVLATITFADLVSNKDLVVNSIVSLSLQRANIPKWHILCTLMTLKNMDHSVRTDFGDSALNYGGGKWATPIPPPLKALSKSTERHQKYGK